MEVNYAGFLYHVVPELAFAKSIDEDVLVDRIARHHMPNPVVERKISFKRSLSSLKSPGVSPVNKAISNNTFKSIKESTVEEKKEENNSAELTDVTSSHMREVVQETNVDLDVNAVMKNQAATVIQSKFRCRLSKRVATNLKQVGATPNSTFSMYPAQILAPAIFSFYPLTLLTHAFDCYSSKKVNTSKMLQSLQR